jgi:GTP cyclohydrolase III
MYSVTVGLVEKMVSEVLVTVVDVTVGVGILRQLQAVDILDAAKTAIHACCSFKFSFPQSGNNSG